MYFLNIIAPTQPTSPLRLCYGVGDGGLIPAGNVRMCETELLEEGEKWRS